MNKPHGESIRIFKNPILEACTHVHPIVPLVMWAPVIAYLFYRSVYVHQLNLVTHLLIMLAGLLVWTFSEYALHRIVFHFPAKGPWGKRFVFLFHGLHHDDPDDSTRLVMPPVPAILMGSLLYGLFYLIVPDQFLDGFMAFFFIGYLCYDYIHYGTHHFKMTSPIARYLKKYHLQHHHSKEASKYGVSSPLWDYIFRTVSGAKKATK
jgi:sterol desaturase/sphingolipid hydroxylase (fatty acid hydroxylase superfamily)